MLSFLSFPTPYASLLLPEFLRSEFMTLSYFVIHETTWRKYNAVAATGQRYMAWYIPYDASFITIMSSLTQLTTTFDEMSLYKAEELRACQSDCSSARDLRWIWYKHLTVWRPVVTICTARCNIQQFYVLPTQCIYVFCVDLRTNSDYFPIQH